MSVAVSSGSLLGWEQMLKALKQRFDDAFERREVRDTAYVFIDGLLSGAERKTGWLLAEQADFDRPWPMQALLGRSKWNAGALRDEVRNYIFETLGDADGVLCSTIALRASGRARTAT